MRTVGTNVPRHEGPQKLTGTAKYIDDYEFKGGLYGATFRSTIARGLIRKITFDPSVNWKEYVIVTAKDIPGENYVLVGKSDKDQPLLADVRVMHPQEPIVLVAHANRQKAYEALKHIHVEYEEQTPVLTIEDSVAAREILYGKDNAIKKFLINKGDVEAGFKKADFIVEGEYRVPHQEQAYIENNGMAAWVEKDGTVVMMGSLQCPYYVHKAMKICFNKPDDKIRVIQSTTGGGFGGKEEYPNMIGGHAALLALKSGKPVKIIYDRVEDMMATTKRHPAIVRHKTGLTKDGKLVAQDIEVFMDGGAYTTLSTTVLSRGTLHASGCYECPNVRVRSAAMVTNTPPNGAFRGFGAPQTLFAAELHWEKIAKVLGIDSLELRRRNIFKEGSVTATNQTLKESVGAEETLDRCVKKSRYEAKRKEYDAWNQDASKPTWKGIGLSVVHHGAGFTGSGEVYLASRGAVSIDNKGDVRVYAASTEMGQGANTIFAQIAAETLGIPYEWAHVETPDTAKVPNSGPTVASRTTLIIGGLVERASKQLKEEMIRVSGSVPKTKAAFAAAGRKLKNKWFEVEYEKPGEIQWDDDKYMGDAYGVYSYGAMAADLEIDKLTYEVKINKVTSAQDIGKAIQPLLAEGQIIGGLTQGVGYSLMENPVYKNGVMVNAQLTNYIIPTSVDTPEMDIEIVEKPYSRGPFGAKGVGELPMDVPGPAIAAAIYHATGLWITELPILPEKILKAFLSLRGAK